MSGMGKRVAYHAPGDPAIRLRVDVTRLFAHRSGERLTVHEVCGHTVASGEKVQALLEELTHVGWLRSAPSPDEFGRVVYWRDSTGG